MTDDNFVQRHNALVAAIEARPDALAEDHLIYAEFLLSGEQTLETTTENVVSSTPAHLIGKRVREDEDPTYPAGVRAQDEDGDQWRKTRSGWEYGGATGTSWSQETLGSVVHYNAVFIA